MTDSEARFTINVREGLVELEGKESFVDKHLEKFEEIFKVAVKEAINHRLSDKLALNPAPMRKALAEEPEPLVGKTDFDDVIDQGITRSHKSSNSRNTSKSSLTIHPLPVDLKASGDKVGLREFCAEKKPSNHYEKTVVFVYYLTKINNQQEVKFGEIMSCYEEVNEKKPSVADIVKNSIRYKGWLEQGSEKYATRLTISGENFVKFDLPTQNGKTNLEHEHPLTTTN
ncbi:MAG TPA: hypothetical protein VGE97_04390 [Nitrososphaera sp.]